MADRGEKQNYSKYKLQLQYGAEGFSEKNASRINRNKRRRIEKAFIENPSAEGNVAISQNLEYQEAEIIVSSNSPNNKKEESVEQILEPCEDDQLQADRLRNIQRDVNLKENEDFLPYTDNFQNNQNDDALEIEGENIEIEEDSSSRDPLQELFDELEYKVECRETEDEFANKFENFLDDPKFYECMKRYVERSPAEVLLVILTFALHAKLPFSQLLMLIKMINALFLESVIPESKYMLDKIFNKMDHVEFHATCPDCEIYVGQLKDENDSVTCSICSKKIDLSNPSCLNFFLVIDPTQYIVDYLERNENYYNDVMDGKYGNHQTIKDIFDGQLYKDFLKNLSEEDRKRYVTAIFNTDGAPRFESSPFSIWPIYLQINELPPQERIRCAIPTALYFGPKKPDMPILLDPFVEMMKKKSENGFEVTIKGESRLVKLYPLVGCADAVARAPMQGMVQFNGYYGCGWCEQKGEFDGSVRYPILNLPEPTLRDAVSTETNAETAATAGKPVDGVKYASPLIKLKYFDIIRGFSPDYMHFFIGVIKQFTEYYYEGLSAENKEILDKVILSFAFPNQICRLSRPLSQRSHWKAKEWENWALYYSLPILELILTERALKHWALLVESLHVLLSTDISTQMLSRTEKNLIQFVKDAEDIFSILVLTNNVHQLLHVCQSVTDWGPVWAHSNFVFESANAILLKAVHCAKGVNLQIVRFINLQHNIRILKSRVFPITDSVIKRYCENVDFPRVQKTFRTSTIRYFSTDKSFKKEYLGEFGLSLLKSQAFSKIVKDGSIYSQKINKRSCNSYVQLRNGQIVKCLHFVVDLENNKEVTFCNLLHTSTYELSEHIVRVTSVGNEIKVVDTHDILKVCVFLKIGKNSYVCPVVNTLYY